MKDIFSTTEMLSKLIAFDTTSSKSNKPMIELVLKNINLEGNYIFICLKEHIEKFSLDTVLKNLKPDCKIISASLW